MRLYRRLGLLAALLCVQAAQAEALSLRQAVEAALEHNAGLAASQARVGQAEAAQRQAEAARWPTLGLSLTASRSDDPLSAFGAKLGQRGVTAADFAPATINRPGAVDNFNTRIEVQWPLYSGGQIGSRIDQAQAQTQAARLSDEATRQQIIQQVVVAYQAVHAARAYLKVAEQARAAAEEALRASERLQAQGVAIKSDVLAARVNLEEAKLKLAEGRRVEAGALDRFKLSLGRSLGDALDVAGEVAPNALAGDEAALRRQALQEHPLLKALHSELDAARARVEAARAGQRPQVNLLGRQDWNGNGPGFDASSYTVAGVLSWRAFDGGVTSNAVDQAQAVYREAAARLRQAEDEVSLQVADARRLALESEARITAREAAATQAEEAQRLVRKRYENGIVTLVELLAGQAQLDRVRADWVAARRDRVTAWIELRRAVGVLNVEQGWQTQ